MRLALLDACWCQPGWRACGGGVWRRRVAEAGQAGRRAGWLGGGAGAGAGVTAPGRVLMCPGRSVRRWLGGRVWRGRNVASSGEPGGGWAAVVLYSFPVAFLRGHGNPA